MPEHSERLPTEAFSPSRPPQAVVFDNDGLLLDTEAAWSNAERRLFMRYDCEFKLEHKHAIMGSSGEDAGAMLADWLGQPGRDQQLLAEVVDLVHEEVADGVAVRLGARELLEALVNAGRPVALASNASRRFIEEVLDSSGLAPLLPVTVSATEVARSKPAPDVYLEAIGRLGAVAERSVALEDSRPGVAAGKAAGMYVIGVPSVAEMALAPPADIELPSLADPAVWALCGLETAQRSNS